MQKDWAKELNLAVTIMDTEGTIIYLNDKAAKTFEKDGGKNLIGKDLKNCHQERSNQIISKLLNNKETNVYTIEKNGIKKLIYQTPWYENGTCMGLVEFSLEIPFDMNHFIR
jgi:transcriptional regulator with PAS, ATPase and Fis domain